MLFVYLVGIIVVTWIGVRLIEMIPHLHVRDALGIAWSFAPSLASGGLALSTRCGLFWPVSGERCYAAGAWFEWSLLLQFLWFPVAVLFLALSLRRQSRA